MVVLVVYCGFALISIPLLAISVDMWSPTHTVAVDFGDGVTSTARKVGSATANATVLAVGFVYSIPEFCGFRRNQGG